jgi:radical SAM superfamily enzyme YgiQ (UPF0313 family)
VPTLRDTIRQRLADETGRLTKEAPYTVALASPSPYRTAMSSLGLQRIYRAIMESHGLACERAFLPDQDHRDDIPRTYESLRPLASFPVVAVSVAYELELAGLVSLLDASRIPVHRDKRSETDPIIVAGGPLTFSNAEPLAAMVDAIVLGEAETVVIDVLRTLESTTDRHRTAQLEALGKIPHVFVPALHTTLPPLAVVDNALLPAWAPIRTPHTEFANMFLIEAERGCSRGCAYCVMRRSTNGGMRLVAKEKLLGLVPDDARKVGLVGAAVSDHPEIVAIVSALADRGVDVGLSSLRPDRMTDPFVEALRRAGTRSLTTAMDGTSERMRQRLERRTQAKHLIKAAELARQHGMDRLKLYVMVGVPGETHEDIDECIAFASELSRLLPVALGIAPFCAKRNTPLHGEPYAGIDVVEDRLDRLRRGLRGRVDVRATSARWAWVEWVLAQGGTAEGQAVIDAVRAGGTFAAYKRAFAARPPSSDRPVTTP